jgi:hypothetical protein
MVPSTRLSLRLEIGEIAHPVPGATERTSSLHLDVNARAG